MLIIWDEAPIANKYGFEALDKTLCHLLSENYPMNRDRPRGGMTIVLGGDFRQIPPIIPKGSTSNTKLIVSVEVLHYLHLDTEYEIEPTRYS